MRNGWIHAFLSYAGVRLLDFKNFVRGSFKGELVTSFKNRPEGVRVKLP
jgi:hypothetical protein